MALNPNARPSIFDLNDSEIDVSFDSIIVRSGRPINPVEKVNILSSLIKISIAHLRSGSWKSMAHPSMWSFILSTHP